MAVNFITILNGVITGKHHGDIDVVLFGTPYYGHERIEVPSDAEIYPFDKVKYYDKQWKRKPDVQLIDEGLLPMPEGYIREGNELRPMIAEERIIAGLDDPQPGYKVDRGKIIEMSSQEKIAAGIITQDDYNRQREAENTAELQRRLADLQTPEAVAQAEIDADFAAERKAKLAALLSVKKQKGWPLEVKWPKD